MSLYNIRKQLGVNLTLTADKKYVAISWNYKGVQDGVELDEIEIYALIRELTHLHKEMPNAPLPWMTENDPDYYSTFPD